MLNMQMQYLKRFLFLVFLIATHSAKSMRLIFWLALFGRFTHRRWKQMTYLESWKNWELEICAFYAKILIWKFGFWSDLDLTSVKSKLKWVHRVKCPSLSISTCKMTQKTYVARHACDLYFLVSFCDLILTFSGMTFVLTHYHSQTFTSTLCEFELFAARLTDPRVKNVKVCLPLT